MSESAIAKAALGLEGEHLLNPSTTLEQVWNILMDQKQPHLAIRINDALKVLDKAMAASTQGADGESLRPVAIDMRDAYAGAREDLLDWKRRALEAEDLNRKFMREINGPTHMGEPVIDTRDATPVVDVRSVAINPQDVAEMCAKFAELYWTDHGAGKGVEDACNAIAEACRDWAVNHVATRDAAPSDPWISAPEALPTKPGNYLAMMADENSFGYTSDEPVLVEFDAYTDHPGQFTISDSWTNGPETATDEVEFWMPLPARPTKEKT